MAFSAVSESPAWSPRVRGCSPGSPLRVRGWSQAQPGDGRAGPVVPARAGVAPGTIRTSTETSNGPRACGGFAPPAAAPAPQSNTTRTRSSPRSRSRRRSKVRASGPVTRVGRLRTRWGREGTAYAERGVDGGGGGRGRGRSGRLLGSSCCLGIGDIGLGRSGLAGSVATGRRGQGGSLPARRHPVGRVLGPAGPHVHPQRHGLGRLRRLAAGRLPGVRRGDHPGLRGRVLRRARVR